MNEEATSKMHKATFFREIISYKLGKKGMISTWLYSQSPDSAKHDAGKGYLLYLFPPCLCKTGCFPLTRTKGIAAQSSKAVSGDLANPLSGAPRESCLFLTV